MATKVNNEAKIASIIGNADDIQKFCDKLLKDEPTKFAELKELTKGKLNGLRENQTVIKLLDGRCVGLKAYQAVEGKVPELEEKKGAGFTSRMVPAWNAKEQKVEEREVKVDEALESTNSADVIKGMTDDHKLMNKDNHEGYAERLANSQRHQNALNTIRSAIRVSELQVSRANNKIAMDTKKLKLLSLAEIAKKYYVPKVAPATE